MVADCIPVDENQPLVTQNDCPRCRKKFAGHMHAAGHAGLLTEHLVVKAAQAAMCSAPSTSAEEDRSYCRKPQP